MTEENFDNLPATKGDLKNFATKDDLKNFATKDDLKNFATKDDLTDAIKNFATKDDIKALGDDLKGFKKEVESSFKELGEAIQLFASHVDTRFEKVEKDVTQIKATMVTKDYLDEKLGDLRGDMTVLVRKEDNKMKTLVEVLVEKEVLNEFDKKRIYSLEPFAQI